MLLKGYQSFGSLIAADDLDLAIAPGEAVGIIGPNGAGKTTLFNLIAGGISPSAGSIRFDGRDITRVPPHRRCRRRHRPLLPDPAAVREPHRVREPAGRRGVRRRQGGARGHAVVRRDSRAARLLTRANTLAGSLTLLERKRLEMARALATEPQLLLLDEIAGGLTEGECHELVATIQRHPRRAASRSCGSSTSCTRCSPWSTGWSCSISAARSRRAIRRTR